MIKKILFLLLFTLSLFAANAKDAAFMLGYNEVYESSLQEAKKEHKVLMMVIVKEPCPYCDKLVDNTLDTPAIKKRLKNFIPLVIAHDGKYPDRLRPPVRPVTHFIDPDDGSILNTVYGYRGVNTFKKAMDLAVKKYKKGHI